VEQLKIINKLFHLILKKLLNNQCLLIDKIENLHLESQVMETLHNLERLHQQDRKIRIQELQLLLQELEEIFLLMAKLHLEILEIINKVQ
jgi:hypothetical protein